ncbi:NAD(P)-dependent oxidoreductase [Paraburkholderia sp. XV]|uniref:NAD(P)-dependent oxidoreductase n=1 Tax=Paraburkholderia sp. XV TaxID=2831520 RepID=UPI001CD57A50|nr:NAD(P)-dependent oxidoreductase [Paraburkholderia sp. XV]
MENMIAVVGLGVMGGEMAKNLLEKGFDVQGFDLSDAARARFVSRGGRAATSLRSAIQGVPIVLTSLPSASALHAVSDELTGEALNGCILIDVSTLGLEDKEFARTNLADKGITMLDCPVSGTGSQAASGDLTVFASGDVAALDLVRPVLDAIARQVILAGDFGSGSKLKFIANHLVTIHNAATAEALTLARKAGIDLHLVFDALKDSAATSKMFQIRGPMVIEQRYAPGMRISTYQKDLDIIGTFAVRTGSPTPLFNICAQLYLAAQGLGHGELDTAAVAMVLETLAGLREQEGAPSSSEELPKQEEARCEGARRGGS